MSTALDGWYDAGHGLVAWFGATSHAHAASVVEPVLALVGDAHPRPLLDVRGSGVRVRLSPTCGDPGLALAITAAARTRGLRANPSGVRNLSLRIRSSEPVRLAPFWRTVLDHDPADGGARLLDPLSRRPDLTFERTGALGALRNRIHVDVGHPGPVAEATASALTAGGCERHSGSWYATLADRDGNEVDLVPGGLLDEAGDVSDWRALVGAMTCYPDARADQLVAIVTRAAELADRAGLPLLVDVRPEGIVLDSGKDRWDGPAFLALAAEIQAAAGSFGLTADPDRLRFTQVGIDAVDVGAVREHWCAVLRYRRAPDSRVSDLFDPHDLEPVVFFQEMSDDDVRRGARNRIRLVLQLPVEDLSGVRQTAIAHGGVALDERTVADPEGNELALVPFSPAAPAP